MKNCLRFGVAALFLAGAIHGCSSAERRNTGNSGGEETGGSEGTPTGGKAAGTGGKATGGSTGSTGGTTGSTGGSTGSTGGSTGSTGGSMTATGGAGGSTGGAGGATGGASGGMDAGAGGMGGPVLSCWPDPKVIKICHQLENACENCPPGGAPNVNPKAKVCFDLIAKAYKGMATDADCEKFAIDNKCTVDNVSTTGNVCGSLDCNPMTCGGTFSGRNCESAKQWGDSNICKNFYAKCPCK
jgi:hypothetical protein